MGKLTVTQSIVLCKTPDQDAYWTSDIAHDARLSTAKARNALESLRRRGLVEQVVAGGMGHPSSWRRTPAGRAALEQSNDQPA